jgi:hypothetical protein
VRSLAPAAGRLASPQSVTGWSELAQDGAGCRQAGGCCCCCCCCCMW